MMAHLVCPTASLHEGELRPTASQHEGKLSLYSCDGPLSRRVQSLLVADVIKAAARVWDVDPAHILGDGIIRQFSHPRIAIYWIANRVLDRSSVQIGAILRRDHSSVLSGVRKAEQLARTDFAFRALLLSALTALELPFSQVPPKTQTGVN